MTGIRTTTLGVAVLSVGLLLGACASPAAKTAAPVAPAIPTHSAPATPAMPETPAPVATPTVAAAPVVQAVPVAQVAPVVQPVAQVAPGSPPPAPPVATTTAPTPPSAKAPPVVSTPASGSAPHFTTPDDAMRYLAAAYNAGDEVAIRHVTTPDSRTEFEAERQWVKTFRFRDCTAIGAPYWTYNCTLDITANVPGVSPDIDATTGLVVMDEVALEVSPAARTGYYMDAVEGCGG
jgi:hypothetical protein